MGLLIVILLALILVALVFGSAATKTVLVVLCVIGGIFLTIFVIAQVDVDRSSYEYQARLREGVEILRRQDEAARRARYGRIFAPVRRAAVYVWHMFF